MRRSVEEAKECCSSPNRSLPLLKSYALPTLRLSYSLPKVVLKQAVVQDLSTESHLILICGHYEGVDHRVITELVDMELSIGDYILTNGAVAAAVLCDAIIRLLPGALGDARSPEEESFSNPNLLEAPAYTKPNEFRGLRVPEVLLSGHHGKIEAWKKEQALKRTRENRPDLLE